MSFDNAKVQLFAHTTKLFHDYFQQNDVYWYTSSDIIKKGYGKGGGKKLTYNEQMP